MPSPRAYEPPSPPSNRDLGPPPPGYGRYADYDRGTLGGPTASQGNAAIGSNGPRRNLDDVLCFKASFLRSFYYLSHYFRSVARRGTTPITVEIEMFQVTVVD